MIIEYQNIPYELCEQDENHIYIRSFYTNSEAVIPVLKCDGYAVKINKRSVSNQHGSAVDLMDTLENVTLYAVNIVRRFILNEI